MPVSYSFYPKSSGWPKNILQSWIWTSIYSRITHRMRSRLVGLFQLVNSPLDETDKIPSPQGVSHLLLQVGAHFRALQGHFKGSSSFICFPSGDLEPLRDSAAGRGQPWSLDWGGDSRILPLHGSLTLVTGMSQMWCYCNTVPTSTACLRLLTLVDNLWFEMIFEIMITPWFP